MEFQDKYRARGFAVIGVSMDEDGWKSVRPFVEKNPFNYPIVVGNEAMAKPYGLESMPMTLLIDRKGRIAASHTGVVDKNSFEKEIVDLLDHRTR
jgi:peroxiredoxin